MKELVRSILGKEKMMNINNKHIWSHAESGRQMGEAPGYFSLFSSVALIVTQIIFELESLTPNLK